VIVASPSAPRAALDMDVVTELRQSLGDQPGTLAAIYRKFLVNVAIHLNDLRTQPASMRAATLHTLRGSAAMVGATRLAELAQRLHAEFRQTPDAPIESAIAALERELDALRAALAAHFAPLDV
jgi:HPt (histidine-containing phosphotransfer) domain-containing protein